jgi:hypothetical protein
VIAARLGLEAAFASWACASICCDPVSELRFRALETAFGGFRVIPDILPFAVNQKSHVISPFDKENSRKTAV